MTYGEILTAMQWLSAIVIPTIAGAALLLMALTIICLVVEGVRVVLDGRTESDSDGSHDHDYDKDDDMDWKPYGLVCEMYESSDTPASPKETNRDALDRLRAVQLKDYNAHAHTGPQADYVFTAPAIFDVTMPATAAYLDAVADAETLLAGADLDVDANRATSRAVDLVEQRWDAAVDFARRNISTVFDPEQRRRMARLVDVVAHGDAESAEAKVARDRLVAMLSEVTYTVPQVGGTAKSVRLNPNALFVPDRVKSVAPAATTTQIGA